MKIKRLSHSGKIIIGVVMCSVILAAFLWGIRFLNIESLKNEPYYEVAIKYLEGEGIHVSRAWWLIEGRNVSSLAKILVIYAKETRPERYKDKDPEKLEYEFLRALRDDFYVSRNKH